jgi:hypothetical protein
VLALLTATCSVSSSLEAACDDDGGEVGNTSLLEVDVVAGETYFLVYDHFGASSGAPGSMTIAAE